MKRRSGGAAWVVMGVSGAGKTEMGRRLAAALGAAFLDADDLHPPRNVAAMASGKPLTDGMRAAWLDACARALAAHRRRGDVVMACSALKRAYRRRLRAGVPGLRFAHLAVPRAEVRERLRTRTGHFMPATLLRSQFMALEAPRPSEGAVRVQADAPRRIVARRLARAARRARRRPLARGPGRGDEGPCSP